jgi:site-specific recombinase XerD
MTATSPAVGPLVQGFFAEHLLGHKRASPQTVGAYRDAFRLLLDFLQARTGTEPVALRLADLDAPMILAFLDHLEEERKNTVQSRNARLAAIRSFFRYVALREPESLAVATRVLAIPTKRTHRTLVSYLTRSEMDAIIAAPDRSEWAGRRDHALLLTLYNTGARVSEITALQRADVHSGASTTVQLHGKGRKERVVPLWARTARVLQAWFRELGDSSNGIAFPNARQGRLTRHGVIYLLDQAVQRARSSCATLGTKRISPHVIRHTTAMHLLQAGVDTTVIALWLGHESIETTHMYVEADLAMKERALGKVAPLGTGVRRFKPDDALMAFLATV